MGGAGAISRSDGVSFLWQELESDGSLSVQITGMSGGNPSGGIGLMLRESLDPGAAFIELYVQDRGAIVGYRYTLYHRDESGGPRRSGGYLAAESPEGWLHLRRDGETIVAQASADGDSWETVGTVESWPPATATVLLGGLVAHGNDRNETVAFEALEGEACELEWAPSGQTFIRGDSNSDGNVDIADAVFVLNWLFAGGTKPPCLAAANVNGDEAADGDATTTINIADPTYLLNFLFAGGLPPMAPYPDCGPATLDGDDLLGCETPPEACR